MYVIYIVTLLKKYLRFYRVPFLFVTFNLRTRFCKIYSFDFSWTNSFITFFCSVARDVFQGLKYRLCQFTTKAQCLFFIKMQLGLQNIRVYASSRSSVYIYAGNRQKIEPCGTLIFICIQSE